MFIKCMKHFETVEFILAYSAIVQRISLGFHKVFFWRQTEKSDILMQCSFHTQLLLGEVIHSCQSIINYLLIITNVKSILYTFTCCITWHYSNQILGII